MTSIKQIIAEIEALAEIDMVDDFEVPPVVGEVSVGATDTLEAKTKISRALDVLIKAVEDFKNETITDIEFIGDNTLLASIEGLDEEIKSIQQNLVSMGAVVEPAPMEVPAEPMDADFEPVESDEDVITDEEDEEDDDFIFDDEAELDLFGDEEDEEDEE
jgi:hypothetical protein